MTVAMPLRSLLLMMALSAALLACASGPRPHWKACDERALEKGYTLADVYADGPSNEDSGYGNRIYGKGNKISGDDNCIIGDENEVRGNRNNVTGSRNKI